jgi:hypothetical protein
MSNIPPKFTDKRTCGHCGGHVPMIIVAKFKEDLDDFIENVGVFKYGEWYELLKCQESWSRMFPSATLKKSTLKCLNRRQDSLPSWLING